MFIVENNEKGGNHYAKEIVVTFVLKYIHKHLVKKTETESC